MLAAQTVPRVKFHSVDVVKISRIERKIGGVRIIAVRSGQPHRKPGVVPREAEKEVAILPIGQRLQVQVIRYRAVLGINTATKAPHAVLEVGNLRATLHNPGSVLPVVREIKSFEHRKRRLVRRRIHAFGIRHRYRRHVGYNAAGQRQRHAKNGEKESCSHTGALACHKARA